MIRSVIQKLVAGERPALTIGEQVWDFLFIDDAIEALVLLGSRATAAGVFNLGSGDPHTVRGVACTIGDLIDPKLALRFGEITYRVNQIMHRQADIQRLTDATGWIPRTDVHDGLRKTVESCRTQLQECEAR